MLFFLWLNLVPIFSLAPQQNYFDILEKVVFEPRTKPMKMSLDSLLEDYAEIVQMYDLHHVLPVSSDSITYLESRNIQVKVLRNKIFRYERDQRAEDSPLGDILVHLNVLERYYSTCIAYYRQSVYMHYLRLRVSRERPDWNEEQRQAWCEGVIYRAKETLQKGQAQSFYVNTEGDLYLVSHDLSGLKMKVLSPQKVHHHFEISVELLKIEKDIVYQELSRYQRQKSLLKLISKVPYFCEKVCEKYPYANEKVQNYLVTQSLIKCLSYIKSLSQENVAFLSQKVSYIWRLYKTVQTMHPTWGENHVYLFVLDWILHHQVSFEGESFDSLETLSEGVRLFKKETLESGHLPKVPLDCIIESPEEDEPFDSSVSLISVSSCSQENLLKDETQNVESSSMQIQNSLDVGGQVIESQKRASLPVVRPLSQFRPKALRVYEDSLSDSEREGATLLLSPEESVQKGNRVQSQITMRSKLFSLSLRQNQGSGLFSQMRSDIRTLEDKRRMSCPQLMPYRPVLPLLSEPVRFEDGLDCSNKDHIGALVDCYLNCFKVEAQVGPYFFLNDKETRKNIKKSLVRECVLPSQGQSQGQNVSSLIQAKEESILTETHPDLAHDIFYRLVFDYVKDHVDSFIKLNEEYGPLYIDVFGKERLVCNNQFLKKHLHQEGVEATKDLFELNQPNSMKAKLFGVPNHQGESLFSQMGSYIKRLENRRHMSCPQLSTFSSYSSSLVGNQVSVQPSLEDSAIMVSKTTQIGCELAQIIDFPEEEWSIEFIPSNRQVDPQTGCADQPICWNKIDFNYSKEPKKKGTVYIYFDANLMSYWQRISQEDYFRFFIFLEIIQAQMKIRDGMDNLDLQSDRRFQLELVSWMKALALSGQHIFAREGQAISVQEVYNLIRGFLYKEEKRSKTLHSSCELARDEVSFSEEDLMYRLSLLEFLNDRYPAFNQMDWASFMSSDLAYQQIEETLSPERAQDVIYQIRLSYNA